MRSIVIGFGLLITCLIALFKLAEFQFTQGNIKLEIIIAVTSLIFFGFGVYFNRRNLVFTSLFRKGPSVNENGSIGGGETMTASGEPNVTLVTGNSNEGKSSVYHSESAADYTLTGREMQVIAKMGEGLSNLEIASALFLSESTIKTHVSNILFKLDAKRRTEAVKIAREKKLIP